MQMTPIFATAFAALALGGCATLSSTGTAMTPGGPVRDVSTDYSLGLACLGGLIDKTGQPALTVFIDPIADLTVPDRYDARRLSSGGMWWMHTAISKLGSRRVQAVTVKSAKADPRNPKHLVLSGAWTQDDQGVGRTSAGLEALLPRLGIELGGQQSVDVIAGDFVSSRLGKVVHASAISVAVSSSSAGLVLEVEDGDRQFGLDFSHSRREGPQFAQRRIAEAAVMVHVARAFDVDYRSCIETGTEAASPQS